MQPSLEAALGTLLAESAALATLAEALKADPALPQAISLIATRTSGARGRVIVTGVGKSGHIAGKIAATLASTGTPAFFVHPTEALHGDLGMITASDVILALSHSGESKELAAIITYAARFSIPIIAVTAVRQVHWAVAPPSSSITGWKLKPAPSISLPPPAPWPPSPSATPSPSP